MVVLANHVIAKELGQAALVQCCACKEAGVFTSLAKNIFYSKHRHECTHVKGYIEWHRREMSPPRKRRRCSDAHVEEGVLSCITVHACALCLRACIKRGIMPSMIALKSFEILLQVEGWRMRQKHMHR